MDLGSNRKRQAHGAGRGTARKAAGLALSFAVLILFPVLSQAKNVYDPSECQRHTDNPDDRAKPILLRSRPLCKTIDKEALDALAEKFRGKDAVGPQVKKLVEEAGAIVDQYVKKSAVASIDQAEAKTDVDNLLSQMRVKRAELEKLEADLMKVIQIVREGERKISEIYTPASDVMNQLIKDIRAKEAELQKGQTELAHAQWLRKTVDATKPDAVAKADGDIRAKEAAVRPLLDAHLKLRKAYQDITGAATDLAQDHKAFDRVRTDWAVEMQNLRIARFRIVFKDPASSKEDVDASRKGMEQAKVPLPGVVAATAGPAIPGEGQTPPVADGQQPGKQAPSKPAPQTEVEQELAKAFKGDGTMIGAGSDAGRYYLAVKEATEAKIAAGQAPTVFAGEDLPEKAIMRSQDTARVNLRDYAECFSDPVCQAAAQTHVSGFVQDVRAPIKAIVGMEAEHDTANEGTHWWSLNHYKPKDEKAFQAQADIYNEAFRKLTPLEQRYVTEVMKMPAEMAPDKLYYTGLATHDFLGKSDGGTWSNIVDTAGGAGVSLWRKGSDWATGRTVRIEDPGWLSIADSNGITIDRFNDNNLVNMKRQNYLANGSTEGMSYYEQFRNNSVTESYDHQLHSWENAKTEFARAEAAARAGTSIDFHVTEDGQSIPIDPQVSLAQRREAMIEAGREATRLNSAAVGEIIANSPELAPELKKYAIMESGMLHGRDAWAWQERKEAAADMFISTVSAGFGQEYVAMKEAAKANYLSAAADTYKLGSLYDANKAAVDSRNMNQFMTGPGLLMFATFQTVPMQMIKGAVDESINLSRAARFGTHAAEVIEDGTRTVRVAERVEVVAHDVEDVAGRVKPSPIEPHTPRPEPLVEPPKGPAEARGPGEIRSPDPVGPPEPVNKPPVVSAERPPAFEGPSRPEIPPERPPPRPAANDHIPDPNPPYADSAPRNLGGGSARTPPASLAAAESAAGHVPTSLGQAGSHVSTAVAAAGHVGEGVVARASSSISDRFPASLQSASSASARIAAHADNLDVVAKGMNLVGSGSRELVPVAAALDHVASPAAAVLDHAGQAGRALGEARSGSSALEGAGRTIASAEHLVNEGAAGIKAADKGVEGSVKAGARALVKDGVEGVEHGGTLAESGVGDARKIAGGARRLETAEEEVGRFVKTGEGLAKDVKAAEETGSHVPKPTEVFGPQLPSLVKAENVATKVEAAVVKVETAAEIAERSSKALAKAVEDSASVAKSGSHAEKLAKWTEPGGPLHKYVSALSEVANIKGALAAAKKMGPEAEKQLLAALAKKEGMTTTKYLKKLDKTVSFFEHNLHETYSIPAEKLKLFIKGVEEGTIAKADIAEHIKDLGRAGMVESHLVRPKIVALEKQIRAVLEEGVRSGNVKDLAVALKDMKVSAELSTAVKDAFKAALETDKVSQDVFKTTVPFIARSIAEAQVLDRVAPTIGRNGIESLKIFFSPQVGKLAYGMGSRYISSPIQRLGQWFSGAPKLAAKSFESIRYEAKLGAIALGTGGKIEEDILRATREFDAASKATKPAGADVARAEDAKKYPAGSLVAKAQELGASIEKPMRDLFAARDIADPMARHLEIERASRILAVDNKLPAEAVNRLKFAVEGGQKSLNKLGEAGKGFELTDAFVREQGELLAQAKYLAEKSVSPRVSYAERSIAKVLDESAKGQPMETFIALRRLGLSKEDAEHLILMERKMPGDLGKQGQLRKFAETVVLSRDASQTLGRNYLLNGYERSIRIAKGIGSIPQVLLYGGVHLAGWAGEKLDPRGLPNYAKTKAELWGLVDSEAVKFSAPDRVSTLADLIQHQNLTDFRAKAADLMVLAKVLPKPTSKEMIASIEKSLIASGQSPESVKAMQRLIDNDMKVLHEGHIASVVGETEKATETVSILRSPGMLQDYAGVLKTGGFRGGETEATATRDLMLRLERYGKEELPDAHSIEKNLEERQKEWGELVVVNRNAAISETANITTDAKGVVQAEFSANTVRDGGMRSEALLQHELYHVDSKLLVAKIDDLNRAMEAATSPEAKFAAKQELLEAISRASSIRALEDGKVANFSGDAAWLNAYARDFTLDEHAAHLLEARKNLEVARRNMGSADSRWGKISALVNLKRAENTLVAADAFGAATAENLTRVRAALRNGQILKYDPEDKIHYLSYIGSDNSSMIRYQLSLPAGLSLEKASELALGTVEHSLSKIEESGKAQAYLASQKKTLSARMNANLLGKTDGAIFDKPTTFRGQTLYSQAALQNEKLAPVRESFLWDRAREAELADKRRIDLAQATEASERIRLLTQEEHYLASERMIAFDDARFLKTPEAQERLAKLDFEHAGVSAQLLGEREARSNSLAQHIGDAAERRKAIDGEVLGGYEGLLVEHFPGRKLEDVRAHPEDWKVLQTYRNNEWAMQPGIERDMRATMAKSIETRIPEVRARAQAEQMVTQLIEANRDAAAIRSTSEREKAVADTLRAKGWSQAQVDACVREGVCAPKLAARTAETKEKEISRLAREVRMDVTSAVASPKIAEEAKTVAKGRERKSFSTYQEFVKDATEKEKALAKELKAAMDRVRKDPKNTDLASRAAEIKEAHLMIQEQIKGMKEYEGALKNLAKDGVSTPKNTGQALGTAVQFLKSPESSKVLGSIHPSLAHSSLVGVVTKAERVAKYNEFTKVVGSLDPQKRIQLFRAVEAFAKGKENEFGKALSSAAKLEDKNLGKAIEFGDAMASTSGNLAMGRAVAMKEISGAEHLALAEALGVVKHNPTAVEAKADAAAKSAEATAKVKSLEAQTRAMGLADTRIAEKEGRAVASVKAANETVETLVKREIEGLKGLSPEERAATLSSVLAVEKSKESAERTLAHMHALSTSNPDMFDAYRLAYVHAEEASRTEKDWNRAWELGVKKMMEDSQYPPEEVLAKYKSTAHCLKI